MSRFRWLLPFLLLALPALAQDQQDCAVVVRLHWPDHDLSNAQLRVFRDAARRDLAGVFPATGDSGNLVMALPPGAYYLTAVVDLNNDGQLNAGDGLGFYGVEDPVTQQPQPLEVKEKFAAVRMPISLVMGEGGKLAPTGVQLSPLTPPPPTKICGVSGVLSNGLGGLQVVVFVPTSGAGPCVAALPAPDGTFSLVVPAGDYWVFAAEDANNTDGLDPGDLMAVYGYSAELGRQFPTLKVEGDMPGLQLVLQWVVGDTGLLKSLDGLREGPQVALETLPAVAIGSVSGRPDASRLLLSASRDARFTDPLDAAATAAETAVLALPAGVYYLSAMTVMNPDGRTRSPGDLIGFYGVADMRKAQSPQPLALRPGEIRRIDMPLTATLDAQLRPVPRGD